MPRMTAPSLLDKPKKSSSSAVAAAASAAASCTASPRSRSRSRSRSPHPRDGDDQHNHRSGRGAATATAGARGGRTKGSAPAGAIGTGGGGSKGKLRARARKPPKVGAERDEVDRALHEARAVRASLQGELLARELRESRDAVLSGTVGAGVMASGSAGGGAKGGTARVFPRLPSNASPPFRPPDFGSPTAAARGAPADGGEPSTSDGPSHRRPPPGPGPAVVTVRIRAASPKPNNSQATSALTPPLYLQGAPSPSLPPSSATVFLRGLVSSEDEQHLTHVPYFGDDDGEDVVSELYDMEKREEMMSAGPEYRARELRDLVDGAVGILRERYGCGGEGGEGEESAVVKEVQRILAEELDVDVEGVAKSWAGRGRSSSDAGCPSSSSNSISNSSNSNFNSNSSSNAGGGGGGDNGGNAHPKDGGGGGSTNGENGNDEASGTTTAEATATTKNSSADRPIQYEHLMDSYRNLFCRRCFTYDCNMHGNITKADASLQGELAVAREDGGYWDDVDFPLPRVVMAAVAENGEVGDGDGAGESNGEGEKNGAGEDNGDGKAGNGKGKGKGKDGETRTTRNGGGGAKKRPAEDGGGEKLTPLQQSLCERLHLMFRGDSARMARVVGADPDAVASYVRERKIESKPFVHVEHRPRPDRRGSASPTPDGGGGGGGGGGGKKRRVYGGPAKAAASGTSMKNYNAAWLKRVEGAEIHPLFIPCDHSGPCSEETCSCVKNAAFCTKHCVWGPRSRNFFRGCNCKAGRCQTKSCACFAARIECDPDLCRSCGACTDDPDRPATSRQRCRNDNIGMRRHCHLLLAPSGIENAGWGIFTKHALKRGDFVHEYVGEVISQEEAERRGRIYDKNNRSYLFNLSSDFVVDASRKGNKTKFANHSSRPNCYTKLVSVNGTARIGLFAQEDIEPQSELFFDYRYDVGMDNDLLHKPGMTVDWMKNPKMANQISKKNP